MSIPQKYGITSSVSSSNEIRLVFAPIKVGSFREASVSVFPQKQLLHLS